MNPSTSPSPAKDPFSLTTTQGSLQHIASLCAQIAMDGVGRLPASMALQIVATAKIENMVTSQGVGNGTAQQILACAAAAAKLQPDRLAPQAKYQLTSTNSGLHFKRLAAEIDPEFLRELEVRTTSTMEAALPSLGFETYEHFPAHVVTPITVVKKHPTRLLMHLLQLLDLMGARAGLNDDLARMAAMGAIQEFLREHYARTLDMKADLGSAEALSFVARVDLIEILKTTTVEPLASDVALFAVPDLPMPVLSHVGLHHLNVARKAERMLGELCGPEMIEVSGSSLLASLGGRHGSN